MLRTTTKGPTRCGVRGPTTSRTTATTECLTTSEAQYCLSFPYFWNLNIPGLVYQLSCSDLCCQDWTFHLVLATYWYYRCEINAPCIQHLLFLLLCNAHIFFLANVYATWIIFCVNVYLYVYIYWIITLSPITLLVRKSWLKIIPTSKIYLKLSTLLKKHISIT